MSQLTLGDIMNLIKILTDEAEMSIEDVKKLPVYIGDDDELNGIHCGWYTNVVDPNNPEDADLVEMINEDRCNIKIEGKAILIS